MYSIPLSTAAVAAYGGVYKSDPPPTASAGECNHLWIAEPPQQKRRTVVAQRRAVPPPASGRGLVLLRSKIGASDGFGNFHITNTK